jgi:uncharacterized protein (DUF1684 family)
MYDGRNPFTRTYLKLFYMIGFRIYFLLAVIFNCNNVFAQNSYTDSLHSYIDGYIKDHEVVKGDDKKLMQFFPVDESYRVVGNFEKAKDSKWFLIETSGHEKKMYRVYGTISLTIHDTLVKLNIYQSQNLMTDPQYKDYLVLMFTDGTSGIESYEVGRYIDLTLGDIKNNKVIIDFNKAYNPYCAYSKEFNCPIPPKENNISIAVRAGEKAFGKKVE